MKMRKLLKTLALVAGIVSGTSAFAAGGNVYEIRPCSQDGTGVSAYRTKNNPMTSGETVYFNVRVGWRGPTFGLFGLQHNPASPNSMEIDSVLYPLQIGIYVSGELRYATLVDVKSLYTGMTDLIFSYTTRTGDFALPIVLATGNGAYYNDPSTIDPDAPAFLFGNTDKWFVKDGAGENCNFCFGNTFPGASLQPEGAPLKDASLAQCGFFVQTIDFDDKWETAGTLWRSVHEGSTVTVGATPSLVSSAVLTNAVTLYVWTMDKDAVAISGGEEVDIVTGYSGGSPVTLRTKIGKVMIAGGQTLPA